MKLLHPVQGLASENGDGEKQWEHNNGAFQKDMENTIDARWRERRLEDEALLIVEMRTKPQSPQLRCHGVRISYVWLASTSLNCVHETKGDQSWSQRQQNS
jgi:hypothetical protein